MKTTTFLSMAAGIFANLLLSFTLTACGDDDDNGMNPNPDYSETIVSTGNASNVSSTTATVSGKWIAEVSLLKDAKFGFVYSSMVNTPTMENGTKVECDEIADKVFSTELSNLNPSTTYYYRACAQVSGTVQYGNAMSFTTKVLNIPQSGAVDLGLSVLWAAYNIGASKPEDKGDYYAWGETETKTNYEWPTYKWCNGSYTTMTKYNVKSDYGKVDNKTVLAPEDDVAHVKWGGNWRMPTKAEQDELIEKCNWTWITHSGVNGYKVTSKTNGNSIFLPAAGYRDGTSIYDAGIYGGYWSSSLYVSNPDCANALYFGSGGVGYYGDERIHGRSIRPVCQK